MASRTRAQGWMWVIGGVIFVALATSARRETRDRESRRMVARRLGGHESAMRGMAYAKAGDVELGKRRAAAVDYERVLRDATPDAVVVGSEPTPEPTTTRVTSSVRDDEQWRYAVVIDAGSTGSRVHVFKFETRDASGLTLVNDEFEEIKPGLSAHANDPKAAADSLRGLMKTAVESVPLADRAKTSIALRATAGLRLLKGGASDAILAECRKLFDEYPFTHDASSVSVMDGVDEGAFQWLTMNYLLGNLVGGGADQDGDVHTVAAVDLGGGSVQLAYQVAPDSVSRAPKGYITKLKALGHTFDVYTHSHLGHGLMAARAAVLAQAQVEGSSPCVHAGHNDTYVYAGETYRSVAHANGSSHDSCFDVAVEALGVDKDCEREKECSFNGAWGGEPGQGSKRVYLSSYLWDRAVNVGIVSDDEIDGRSSVKEFKRAAEDACKLDVKGVIKKYHGIEEKDAPYLCMDLTFAQALLSVGFAKHGWDDFTLVKRIEYQGRAVEAAWPLGAALNSM
ncbi:Nucleoside phosphatase GDA1/CD39 [Ostreococcus tauri]|uniref:Nucleoside phosphatase GDA1/CD39 n=2 Tax=Ostreococcus tauri TaxID=70448 RepID=A0A090LZN8_OSTTA|nr:Nucleoside phosphatase GDA1/CD39 [Ostreococcus tauri]CEF97475.1 Nucleoside phosphatase GDA1/CD39 [Ostreococcus tauri]|eukprot:XP_003078647.2 Nucleoside phosphatase GDA1/CD39 [Ostreococcus tauri]